MATEPTVVLKQPTPLGMLMLLSNLVDDSDIHFKSVSLFVTREKPNDGASTALAACVEESGCDNK